MYKECNFSFLLIPMTVFSADAIADEVKYVFGVSSGASQFQLNESELAANYAVLTHSSSYSDNPTASNLLAGMGLDQYLALELDLLSAGDIVAREAGRSFKLFDVSILVVTLAMSK
jgi:hypothetical protein